MPNGKKIDEFFYPYRIFTILALFFLAGIFTASFLKLSFYDSWPVFLLTMFCLVFAAFSVLRERILVLLSAGLVAFIAALTYFSFFENRVPPDLPFGQKTEITGKIVKKPEIDFKTQKLVVEINDLNGEKALVLINAEPFPNFYYGEILKINGVIEEPENFGDFDYKNYLKRYLIFGLIQRPEIVYLDSSRDLYDRFLGGLYYISETFESSLNRVLPEPQASLASGILLGVKRNIPDTVMDSLNNAGLTHIIALSGYNVTIIVSILATLLAPYLGRKKTFYFGFILVVLFVLLTGASSSVVRAAIFSLLILFGGTIGRKADQTNLLLFTALLMVLVNPLVMRYDIGFQLSFLAFAGLIYFSGPIFLKTKKLKIGLSEKLKKTLAETLGAQLAVLPLIWFQFGRFSLIAPISNLLILPMIPLTMAFIFIVGLISFLYYPMGQIAALAVWPLLEYIIKIADWLSKIPLSSFAR